MGYPNYFFPQSMMWREASNWRPSPDLSDGDPQNTAGVSPNTIDATNNTRCVDFFFTDILLLIIGLDVLPSVLTMSIVQTSKSSQTQP